MGFGSDLLSAFLEGAEKGLKEGFRESRIEEITQFKEVINGFIFKFTAIYVQKVKSRNLKSFWGYISDLSRLLGMICDVELYESVDGISGNIIQVLSQEDVKDCYNSIYHIFNAIKNYYNDYQLESVDLNEFFSEQALMLDSLFVMGWSNRKIYKASKVIIFRITEVLRNVLSDLDEMLNLV